MRISRDSDFERQIRAHSDAIGSKSDRLLDNCSEFPIKLEVRRVVSVSAPVGSRDAALEPPWMGSRRGAETLTALRTHAYVKWNSEQLSSSTSEHVKTPVQRY